MTDTDAARRRLAEAQGWERIYETGPFGQTLFGWRAGAYDAGRTSEPVPDPFANDGDAWALLQWYAKQVTPDALMFEYNEDEGGDPYMAYTDGSAIYSGESFNAALCYAVLGLLDARDAGNHERKEAT